SDPRLHFGLGTAPGAEYAEVTWPSGQLKRYVGLSADAGYLLREAGCEPEPLKGFPIARRTRPIGQQRTNVGAHQRLDRAGDGTLPPSHPYTGATRRGPPSRDRRGGA